MALTSEAISMLKEKNVKSVLVSIDHILPEYHDAFRGVEGCYARAIEAIKECVSKKISNNDWLYAKNWRESLGCAYN